MRIGTAIEAATRSAISRRRFRWRCPRCARRLSACIARSAGPKARPRSPSHGPSVPLVRTANFGGVARQGLGPGLELMGGLERRFRVPPRFSSELIWSSNGDWRTTIAHGCVGAGGDHRLARAVPHCQGRPIVYTPRRVFHIAAHEGGARCRICSICRDHLLNVRCLRVFGRLMRGRFRGPPPPVRRRPSAISLLRHSRRRSTASRASLPVAMARLRICSRAGGRPRRSTPPATITA